MKRIWPILMIEDRKEIFDFYEEDLIWAANMKYMNNEKIFDEFMYLQLGYEDELIDKITSAEAFSINVNELAIFNRQTDKKINMGSIPVPMILESGHNYAIGQGNNGELMIFISTVLENEDWHEVKALCQKTMTQANVYLDQKGYQLARMGLILTTTLTDPSVIENEIKTYIQAFIPNINLYIHIKKVDRIFHLESFKNFWGF
jgi:hypothetical protein